MARKASGDKPKKRKKVTVQLIKEKHAGEITEPYRLLGEIRKSDHGHLSDAKIGLAWRMGWRTDTDGHMRLGQCRKRGDLDRELDGFDFIILLNKEAWPTLNEKQKRALLDHELCHAQLSMDADGNPKYNDRDRLVCRTKKHDVEEFRCIVERHGVWTQDLEAIAKAAMNDAKRPLLKEAEKGGKASRAKSNGQVGSKLDPFTDDQEWRKSTVEVLQLHSELTDKQLEALELAGVRTLGQLQDEMTHHGDFWCKDLKIHGRHKQPIEDAFNAFLCKAAQE